MNASTSLALEQRGLPATPEAERGILGSVMLDNHLCRELATLADEDFYLDAHRRIFRAMISLSDQHRPIDHVTLPDELAKRREMETVGGVGYIATLTNGIPRRDSLAHYASILRRDSTRRKLIHMGEATIASAMENSQTPEELIEIVQRHCTEFALRCGEGEPDIFVDATEFCSGPYEQPDWVIEGLVEKGSNGIVAADPKGAKSLTVAGNMSVCLALGIPWLGLKIPRRTRVALVSREDNPATTKRRINQILHGKGAHLEELEGFLHINSKAQSKTLMLDNPREVNNLIRCLNRWQSEFVILDVFNKLHSQDENANTDIRVAVMNQLDRIESETGAQMCVLHHWNKGDASQGLTRRIRGAGAIAGYAEWIAGIEMTDEATQLRCMKFEGKCGYVKPINYRIVPKDTYGNELPIEQAHSAHSVEFQQPEFDETPLQQNNNRRRSDPGARL